MPEPLYAITPARPGTHLRRRRPRSRRPRGLVPARCRRLLRRRAKALWSRFAEADERGRLLMRLNLLLIESAGKRVLVETGTGVRMTDKDRDIKGVEGGDPAAALRAVGEDPAEHRLRGGQPPALRPRRRHGRRRRQARTFPKPATSSSATRQRRPTATSCAWPVSWSASSSSWYAERACWPR